MEINENHNVMKELSNYNLLPNNTFGIEARCKRFLEYSSVADAQKVAQLLNASDDPLLIIGGGSNLLLTKDFQGTVVHSTISGYETETEAVNGDILMRCGAGMTWDDVVDICVENGWHGAENLSLIPGEVGASAIQNIGAYGAEAKDIIEKVEAVCIETGEPVELSKADCQYAYRDSRFKNDWKNKFLITYVTYRLSKAFNPDLDYGNIRNSLNAKGIDMPTASQLRQTIIEIRRAKLPDPEVLGNAGSFFKNPIVTHDIFEKLLTKYENIPHYIIDESHIKIPAGWMIEQCGWKGRNLGHAGVHKNQALVLVNNGGATGKEILELCNRIIADVKNRFGIEIHPEVNII